MSAPNDDQATPPPFAQTPAPLPRRALPVRSPEERESDPDGVLKPLDVMIRKSPLTREEAEQAKTAPPQKSKLRPQ